MATRTCRDTPDFNDELVNLGVPAVSVAKSYPPYLAAKKDPALILIKIKFLLLLLNSIQKPSKVDSDPAVEGF